MLLPLLLTLAQAATPPAEERSIRLAPRPPAAPLNELGPELMPGVRAGLTPAQVRVLFPDPAVQVWDDRAYFPVRKVVPGCPAEPSVCADTRGYLSHSFLLGQGTVQSDCAERLRSDLTSTLGAPVHEFVEPASPGEGERTLSVWRDGGVWVELIQYTGEPLWEQHRPGRDFVLLRAMNVDDLRSCDLGAVCRRLRAMAEAD